MWLVEIKIKIYLNPYNLGYIWMSYFDTTKSNNVMESLYYFISIEKSYCY